MKKLISSHDAGGANLLLHKYRNDADALFVLTGPAALIADALGIKYSRTFTDTILENVRIVIVSSNSQPQLSDQLLIEAKSKGIRTLGILDHWVNYPSRWSQIPDQIEVQDLRAFLGAIFIFRFRVRLRKNNYLTTIRNNFKHALNSKYRLLVILQPIALERADLHGSSCLCNSVSKYLEKYPAIQSITFRPHFNMNPKDCVIYLQSKYQLPINLSHPEVNLGSDLSLHFHVMGYDSYAMFVAKKMGCKVSSVRKKRRSWFAPKYRFLN